MPCVVIMLTWVLLLILILGPFYGHTRFWMPLVFCLAAAAFAIALPCVLVGQFRVARYKRC